MADAQTALALLSQCFPSAFSCRRIVNSPARWLMAIPGTVEIETDGNFRAPVKLYKDKPGIYTLVAWIISSDSNGAFPATAVCIRAE